MKKQYIAILAAVSMTAGTMAVWGADNTDQTVQTQQQVTTNTDPATTVNRVDTTTTDKNKEAGYVKDIQRVLARVTEDAVKGNVTDVADNFTTASQDQFNRYGKKANLTGPDATANTDQAKKDAKAAEDDLKNTSKQFMDAWKAKYNNDFDIGRKNEAMVYAGPTFEIMKGQATNNGQPQAAGAQLNANETNTSTDKTTSAKDNNFFAGKSAAGTNMDKRMATVTVQESHGMPNVQLSLINEGTFGNRWHIQPPVGLDYKSLATNLNQQLQSCLSMKDQWPADENQAYQAISHHVLSAIAMPMGSQANGQSSNSAQPAGYTTGQQNQQNQSK